MQSFDLTLKRIVNAAQNNRPKSQHATTQSPPPEDRSPPRNAANRTRLSEADFARSRSFEICDGFETGEVIHHVDKTSCAVGVPSINWKRELRD